ncbi:eamA-like transporter family protein [Burkholderia thailandensis MSMB121]|uniref:DMT family transporter n=1 Tax=Burkholderia humptydooensis TaxID=430531 RepID=UPI000327EDEB|nr:DMT family transporter [Burkholderia humptydooensis]AGK47648.1 eamA-like transporter family protein [Burkholderia thailandensis MSMB121]ATF34815.1 EamA/RhaT family transporter [Burkholderia thailandensis]KST75392.1 multidrug DMT transporter permease [Burkholderia humptydooensis]
MSAVAGAPARPSLDLRAIGVMVLLCAIWGFQQVAIKSATHAIPPMLQAGLRSAIAALGVWAWASARGTSLFRADGTFAAGIVAGTLFAGEFVCLFFGLTLTSAARMAIFLYTAPCFTALGLHLFAPGEKMRRLQWAGVAIAFAGIAVAFADGFARPAAGGASALAGLAGDALGVLGGVMWAATTVVVRSTPLARASASKTLFYQLTVSSAVLLGLAVVTRQTTFANVTPLAVASLAYQGVIVAFASYLAWYWLLTRYSAARLSVFTFLAPLFGVSFGVLLLGDAIGPRFVAAAALVLAGIALVNAPPRGGRK